MTWTRQWGWLLWAAWPLAATAQAPEPGQALCWREGRKLTWGDFQAQTPPPSPPVDPRLPGGSLAANTHAVALVYDFAKTATPQRGKVVTVCFDRGQSWVDRAWLNKTYDFDRELTLEHEQLHFDIVELTGRKIRRLISEFVIAGKSVRGPEFDAALLCLYYEENELQDLYDDESVHGNDWSEQYRWETYVAKELAKLARYKSTAETCLTKP